MAVDLSFAMRGDHETRQQDLPTGVRSIADVMAGVLARRGLNDVTVLPPVFQTGIVADVEPWLAMAAIGI